jgi:predicted dehydrogenase
MTDIRPMKIALIGCGDIARKSYVPACRKFPFLDLVACADIDTARAAAFAGELSIRSSGSVDQILADPSIELVVNLTIPTADRKSVV